MSIESISMEKELMKTFKRLKNIHYIWQGPYGFYDDISKQIFAIQWKQSIEPMCIAIERDSRKYRLKSWQQ